MAFEDLLQNNQNNTSHKPKASWFNFASYPVKTHNDQALKREELLQSIMICQGEYDYLVLQVKVGKKELLNDLLGKKMSLLEKNIIFVSSAGVVDTGDLRAINNQSDKLTKYRMELEAVKRARQQDDQYTEELKKQIDLGVDFEGIIIDNPENYLSVVSEKLKFGGIIDQGKVSRLCGFASMAAKNGDLVLALKSYSIAGMIVSIKDDFKKIIKKAKKEKNPQYKEAEELLNNLLPKNKRK